MLEHLLTALENRTKALEAEATKLVQDGKTEAAAIKLEVAGEFAKLKVELESILNDL